MIVACLMSVVDSDERMEMNNRISSEFQLRHQMQTVNNVFSNSESNSTLSSSSSMRSTRERPTTLKLSISIPDSLPDYNDLGIENNGKFRRFIYHAVKYYKILIRNIQHFLFRPTTRRPKINRINHELTGLHSKLFFIL